jgi:hypothetical protein
LAAGSPGDWPVNVAPADLGLGPYDLPAPEPQSAWTFEADAESWAPMMGLADVRAGDGALRARTVSDDPAFVFNAAGLEAGAYGKAYVVMRLEGGIDDDDAAQLFWSADGAAMGEAASRRTALKTDGQTHRYVFGVKYNPRWRGSIGQLRFDPCSVRGVEVVIEEFGFE